MITVLDYGMGNIRSVQKALESIGATVSVSESLRGADKVVLPGVGAFGAAMARLEPLREEILAFAGAGRPLLGICLGQQLLFEGSEELGETRGLGILKGRVRYLPAGLEVKIPHVGWSSLRYTCKNGIADQGIDGEQVYFVHSLYTECADPNDVVATANYAIEFPAAVARDNVWGVQFHPEKSGAVGLRMLKAFVEC